MDQFAARWPDRGPVYASGMIGSNVGWTEVPYAEAPAGCADLAAAAAEHDHRSRTDAHRSRHRLPPQLRRSAGHPARRGDRADGTGGAACRRRLDRAARHAYQVGATRRTAASSISSPACRARCSTGSLPKGCSLRSSTAKRQMARCSCEESLPGGARQLALGTLLFSARAQVVRGALAKTDAASYIRGLLIGSEIADALAVYPGVARRRRTADRQ